jgi:acetyl esterase/lipase
MTARLPAHLDPETAAVLSGLPVLELTDIPAARVSVPAELDDAYATLRWTYDQSGRLGVDRHRIAVGGASSGGGTAAGLALLARDRGEVSLCYQLLIYPMLDDRTDARAYAWLDGTNLWHRAKNRLAWRAYVGDGAADPYAAPARAADLSGLPPAFIGTGDLDLFAEEDARCAARLIAAGVPTELHVYPGGVHGFELFVPDGRLARQMARDRDEALATALRFRNAPAQDFNQPLDRCELKLYGGAS